MKKENILENEDYKIEKIEGYNIFNIDFTDSYNMAMMFMRYQEFYESPKFSNKPFTILEFVDWYSKKHGDGCFTYCKDWVGFNIPSRKIFDCMQYIPDLNHYDLEMKEIVFFIKTYLSKNNLDEKFYLIASCNNNIETFKHEIAHGLYFLNDEYKQKMLELNQSIDVDVVTELTLLLTDIGYCHEVIDDEIQAYLSTGLHKSFKKIKGIRKSILNKYKAVYELYTNERI